MVFKAFNNTAGPDSLVPTLLVFSVYLRIAKLDIPSLIVIQRANIVKKAIVEIRKLYIERQVANTLNIRNGPKTDTIYNLPLNLLVLVQREGNIGHLGYQDRPFTLLIVKGEIYIIKLISGSIPFRSIVIKLYLRLKSTKKPTLYNAVEYAEPARVNEPIPLLQEATP